MTSVGHAVKLDTLLADLSSDHVEVLKDAVDDVLLCPADLLKVADAFLICHASESTKMV